MAKSCECPYFKNVICRSEKNKEECGGFLYRCRDLNCSAKIYQKAIKRVNEYNFSQIDKSSRTNREYYYKRKIVDCGKRESITEAYLCRCQYYMATGKCDKGCNAKWISQDYSIVDYQLPVSDDYNGKVDLIIKKNNTQDIYLVEYKPDRIKGAETLMRMIAEIVTYSVTVKKDDCYLEFLKKEFCIETLNNKIHSSIMFHENSPQHDEWKVRNEGISLLINKYKIKVFIISEDNEIMPIEEF